MVQLVMLSSLGAGAGSLSPVKSMSGCITAVSCTGIVVSVGPHLYVQSHTSFLSRYIASSYTTVMTVVRWVRANSCSVVLRTIHLGLINLCKLCDNTAR